MHMLMRRVVWSVRSPRMLLREIRNALQQAGLPHAGTVRRITETFPAASARHFTMM